MKLTLLLTILGVSANTAVSAFDLPKFLRGNNNDQCECKKDNQCSGGSDSWCDQDVNCSGDEFGNDGGFCVYENDNADECNNKGDCNNNEFCNNQGYCRRRFNGDRSDGRVCDYKQCTNKDNQDLCQCNLNNSRCEKGSKVPANTCDFIENTDENGCCIPGAGANMFLADEIQDQDFGEEE